MDEPKIEKKFHSDKPPNQIEKCLSDCLAAQDSLAIVDREIVSLKEPSPPFVSADDIDAHVESLKKYWDKQAELSVRRSICLSTIEIARKKLLDAIPIYKVVIKAKANGKDWKLEKLSDSGKDVLSLEEWN